MSLNLDDLGSDHFEDDYDSDSSESTPRNSYNPSPSTGFSTYNGPTDSAITDYLLPSLSRYDRPSGRHFASSSSSASDSESETGSPFLRPLRGPRRRARRTWWQPPSRRRSNEFFLWRPIRRCMRIVVYSPFFPRQPLTIVLSLILFCTFAVLLTLFLMYILNPDKEPLPWRAYCSVPPASLPSPYVLAPTSSTFQVMDEELNVTHPIFPPPNFDSLPPAGVFIGVFSMDSSFERRMLIRTTYASHPRSRNGAGEGDDGAGTSRTIVRFILGQPQKEWDRRIRLEMETYNDMVILPVQENMNGGKSHAFFSWAASHAWVPPLYQNSSAPTFSYSNESTPPPPLAIHDPIQAYEDLERVSSPQPWVRPDFIVKVDDDAFVMLAELEGRLRAELHLQPTDSSTAVSMASSAPVEDPLIYWGYLVANRLHRFMAGELYALSWSIVTWIASDPIVKTMITGAEDKQTSKWMKVHPRASEVRWTSERCWIYDHPRAGSVYAHGFLFPSERTRVKETIMDYPERTILDKYPGDAFALSGNGLTTPPSWARSSVSAFRTRYEPPITDLSTRHSVEAMVEGSAMSKLRHGAPTTPEYAWSHREGRRKQYENQRLGGTIVVHFIKKHLWFIETALSLLEGDEFTEVEKLSFAKDSRVTSPPVISNETAATILPSTAHRSLTRRRLR